MIKLRFFLENLLADGDDTRNKCTTEMIHAISVRTDTWDLELYVDLRTDATE